MADAATTGETKTPPRIALVTGASRGIGAATALALAARGVHVVLTGRSTADLETVEERIFADGGSATIAPLDLTSEDAIRALASAIAERWHKLDVLVLSAATLGTLSPVHHIDTKEWPRVLALNVTAQLNLISAFDPLLRASGDGRLIAVTSSVGRTPRAFWGAYGASKAALETLVAAYGEENRNLGRVRVAIVDPGATRTAMRARAFPGEDPASVKSPDVVGEALAALALSDFATGHRERVKDQ